jgi:hypothetical protein
MVDEKEVEKLKEAVRMTVFSPTASEEFVKNSPEMRALDRAKECNLEGILFVKELLDISNEIRVSPVSDKERWNDLHGKLRNFLDELKKECQCRLVR